jgi:hypothetical protein
MCAAPDSRQGLFWIAFIIQASNQPYELSLIVPNCPLLSLNVRLKNAYVQITKKYAGAKNFS